jgi:hypothetical protein
MPLVIRETDLILPEPGPCDSGLSTLLILGTGKGTTQKFWIASCLVEGAGLMADRFHSSDSALRYLEHDTFQRLVPEYARQLTAVDLVTLLLVWNTFMTFQHFPATRIPTSLQQFVSAASEDIALRLGDPDVFSYYMAEIIEYMSPPPAYLRRLTANVQPYDVPTVVADLKTFIFADSLQDKPNSVPVLRILDAHLSSFAHSLLLPLYCGLAALRLLFAFGPLRLSLPPHLRPPPLRWVLPRRRWCDVPWRALARWHRIRRYRRFRGCRLGGLHPPCLSRLVVLFRQALPPLLFRWV